MGKDSNQKVIRLLKEISLYVAFMMEAQNHIQTSEQGERLAGKPRAENIL